MSKATNYQTTNSSRPMAKAKEKTNYHTPSTSEQLRAYIRSGKAGIVITSFEEVRVECEIKKIASDLEWKLNVWTVTDGVINVSDTPPTALPETEDPLAMLQAFEKLPEKSIILAKDFHMFLKDPNPVLVRKVKDVLANAKSTNKTLIIAGCQMALPMELEKECALIEFKLPDRAQLLAVLENLAQSANIKLNANDVDALLDAASGLTTSEAEDAFSLSFVKAKAIIPEIVAYEKAGTVKKNGILEIVDTELTLDDMGGLDLYKEHLWSIRNCFTKAARDYGLPSPRPVICCGQPGTGKSMSAMACKNVFGLPLLRLEAGRLFGSLVGQSEANWRSAFTTAKAIAPAVLWIDEAEGLFSGMQSSGQTDGGTTLRVLKAILQDMQFNGDGLFFVFTSNDIDQFPDPLIDRCDVWSFDLPTRKEREAIWKIHIAKRKRKPDAFDIQRLADNTEGYSGRQIEQVWLKALTAAFNDNGREPTESDMEAALQFFVPTSITMKDAIERRRQRLQNRARSASIVESKVAVKGQRKLA